jgi:hypothetical protein
MRDADFKQANAQINMNCAERYRGKEQSRQGVFYFEWTG